MAGLGSPQLPELLSLRLLVQIGALGSLSAAARAQGISQPAASKRLRLLERDLGLPLVLRSTNGSRLSPHGQVVADWAGPVLDSADRLLGSVAALAVGARSDLKIAASMTIAEHLMPGWLSEMSRAHPALHLGLEVANSEQVQALVLSERADIGFVEGPSIDPALTARRITRDRLVVVVAPSHPWAARTAALTRRELLEAPLVVREVGSGTRLTLDRTLGNDHAAPLLEMGSNEAVKGAVMAGAGPAVLSVLAVAAELSTGRLVELDVEDVGLDRHLVAVWRRGTRLADPCRWLLQTASSAHPNQAPLGSAS